MDHRALKATKDNLAHQEMRDLREPKEKKVNSAVLVHHLREGPQATLALLAALVKMDLWDLLEQWDRKVILALLEVMDQLEILEIRVSRVSLEIQDLKGLKVKRDKFSAWKVTKGRRVNQALRDLQETKVLTENKVTQETQALLDQQDPQAKRVNQAMMGRMEVLGPKVIRVMMA